MRDLTVASQRCIFIVDDDPSFGKSLARLLKIRGYPAESFSSARSFLDSISPDQSGVAVLDIHMPECDGFKLFEKMKEQHFCMPVIFITGQAQTDERSLAMQKGARGFLLKPFSERSLLELLSAEDCP
jgi:FixJ family two-component response regulator